MDYRIIKLGTEDLNLAKALLTLWQEEDSILPPSLPDDNYLMDLLHRDDFHLLVAISNGQVVGGLTAHEIVKYYRPGAEMFLYEIGVIPEHRQKGIAKSLIEALKNICRTKQIDVMFLGTSMDNDAAQRLYFSTEGDLEIIPWFTYNL
jgi:aminoglycoside 3-N-acetyltransferase I